MELLHLGRLPQLLRGRASSMGDRLLGGLGALGAAAGARSSSCPPGLAGRAADALLLHLPHLLPAPAAAPPHSRSSSSSESPRWWAAGPMRRCRALRCCLASSSRCPAARGLYRCPPPRGQGSGRGALTCSWVWRPAGVDECSRGSILKAGPSGSPSQLRLGPGWGGGLRPMSSSWL